MQKEDVTCYGQLFCNRFYLKCELVVDGKKDSTDFAQTEIILINRNEYTYLLRECLYPNCLLGIKVVPQKRQ